MPTVNEPTYNTGGNYAVSAGWRGPTNSWVGVRGATTGTAVGQSNPAIRVSAVFGGRGVSYNLSRVWMWFDLSSYAPNITDLELKIATIVSPNMVFEIMVVEGDGFNNNTNTTLTTAEFNDLDFNNAYLNSAGSWTNAVGTNSYTLNSTAVTDANNNSKLGICVINDQWDYNNVDPYSGLSFDFSNYLDWTNISKHAIGVTYTTGYGNDVNGISSTDIGSINGIATGDISTMNGL